MSLANEPVVLPEWRLRRREAILAAADALFRRRPFHDVQMDDVAREAGVGKATLYRYFPSKDDLYLESFDRALAGLEERLEEPAPADAPPRARLAGMVAALLDTMGGKLPALKVLAGDHSDLAERTRRLFRARSVRIAAALRGVLEAGIAGGQFRDHLDLAVTPILIIGMVRGAVMSLTDQPRDRLEHAILDLVLNGAAIPNATTPNAATPNTADRGGHPESPRS